MRCTQTDSFTKKQLEAGGKTSPASLIYNYDFKYYYRLISVVRITNFIGEYNQKETL